MPYKDPDDNRACERRRNRRLTAKRVAQGLCTKCGKSPLEPDRRLCASCGGKKRAAERARYSRAKAEGKPYGGRDRRERRRRGRSRAKRLYRERRAAGTCTRCGERPPSQRSTACQSCRNKRRANEHDSWAARRAGGLCGKCGAPVDDGAARCAGCADIQARGVSPLRKNAASRKRYARRRARNQCTDCGTWSAGAARCKPCAYRSWARSAEHRGLPAAPARYTVVDAITGHEYGTFESHAEVAGCLAFSWLCADDVEIVVDAPVMANYASWA